MEQLLVPGDFWVINIALTFSFLFLVLVLFFFFFFPELIKSNIDQMHHFDNVISFLNDWLHKMQSNSTKFHHSRLGSATQAPGHILLSSVPCLLKCRLLRFLSLFFFLLTFLVLVYCIWLEAKHFLLLQSLIFIAHDKAMLAESFLCCLPSFYTSELLVY